MWRWGWWPTEEAEQASYGADHLRVIADHFADILDRVGCDNDQARHKEVIKVLTQVQQSKVWPEILTDLERLQSFLSLQMVVELILMIPLSTADWELGFSATDWWSNRSFEMLWKLLNISIEGQLLVSMLSVL